MEMSGCVLVVIAVTVDCQRGSGVSRGINYLRFTPLLIRNLHFHINNRYKLVLDFMILLQRKHQDFRQCAQENKPLFAGLLSAVIVSHI